MEKAGAWDQETVIIELTRGRKLANQLQKEFNPTASSREACDFLLEKILSSYDNALTLLDYMASLGNGNHWNEASFTDSKDQVHVSKKRKTQPKPSEQVRLCSGTGVENDGYNWRKYGQKEIQGTTHPRAYFRCTHRHTRGCLATKQVQKNDGYPSTFDVIYRGKHTCMREMMKHDVNVDVIKKEEAECKKPDLEFETQEKCHEEENFLDFSFPTTPVSPVSSENMGMRSCPVPEWSYLPPFLSPATPESYFSLSPGQVNDFGIGHNFPSSESDSTEILSNPTPQADFSPGDLDSWMDFVDFDTPLLDAYEIF